MYENLKPLIPVKSFLFANLDEIDRTTLFEYIASYNGDRPASIVYTICHLNGTYTVQVVQDFENPEFTMFMDEVERKSSK